MSISKILIVLGEPYGTFSEILGKYFKKNQKHRQKIILIGNLKLLKKQLNKLKHSFKINKIDYDNEAIKDFVNIIDIEHKYNKVFDKISTKSNKYIKIHLKLALIY